MAMGKKVLQKIINDSGARELLGQVGESLELDDKVRSDMKSFVLSNIYSESVGITCAQARTSKWHMLKKKSTMRLPPDDDSLGLHLERTNYLSYCQLHYDLREHPSPIGHGWEIINGKCRPVRHTLPALPESSRNQVGAEIVQNGDESSSDDDASECGESTDSDEG